jgi:hypothetical protein
VATNADHGNFNGWGKIQNDPFLERYPLYSVQQDSDETGQLPLQLIRGLMYAGMNHHLFAGAEVGKSWVAMWVAKKVAMRGFDVLYIDYENGSLVVNDRFNELNVKDSAHEHLRYCEGDRLNLYDGLNKIAEGSPVDPWDNTGYVRFRSVLKHIRPALTVWDSWAAALESCGFDENSNRDIQRWCRLFLEPAKRLFIASLVVDHTSHNNNGRAIGGVRKRNEMDVQWRVKGSPSFDRETIDTVPLILEKDRHGCMHEAVNFDFGGTPFQYKAYLPGKDTTSESTEGASDKTPVRVRIINDIRENGAGTCKVIANRTGINLKSIKNQVSVMRKDDTSPLKEVGEDEKGEMIVDFLD